MLVLTRKPGEAVRIGRDLVITVKEIRGKQVRLGIEAPASIPVYRQEIYDALMESNRQAIVPEQLSGDLLKIIGDIPRNEPREQDTQEVTDK